MTHENVIEFAAKEGWRLTEKSPAILFGRELLHLPKVKFKESAYDDGYESALEYKTEQSNGGGIHVVYHQPSSRLFVYYSAN
jgi:hypothetical protein